LRSRRGLCLSYAALLQLLKRSKNARALAIEFGETVLEVRNLLIRRIVHRHARSRLQDKTEVIRGTVRQSLMLTRCTISTICCEE
jgi:hypothetical protein